MELQPLPALPVEQRHSSDTPRYPETDVPQLNFNGTPFFPKPETSVEAPLEPKSMSVVEAEASRSGLGRLVGWAGELATKAVIRGVVDTYDHLKQRGGRIVARSVLAGLALAAGAGFIDHKSVDAGYASYPAHTEAPLRLHPSSPNRYSSISEVMPNGTTFNVQCFTTGTSEHGDAIWDFGMDARNGLTGYASDWYLSTPDVGYNGREAPVLEAAGIPECGTGSTTTITSTPAQQNSGPQPANHLPCTPVLVVGARGSGNEYRKDASGLWGFDSTLAPVVNGLISHYGKDNVTAYGLPYPADDANQQTVLLRAYQDSVNRGVKELKEVVTTQAEACPDQLIDLVGYSQGAEVVNNTISQLPREVRDHIKGVVTFGDPQFNGANSEDRGSYNHAFNGIKPSAVTRDGELLYRQELPDDMLDKARSYCDKTDIVCNVSLESELAKGSGHFHYATTHASEAERFLESRDVIVLTGQQY